MRVDLADGRLHGAAGSANLRPKTLAVLRVLLERPGRLVTREELLAAVWPDTSVTDDTLTRSIRELRLLLADDARAPRFLETVHRRGFRVVARIHPAADGKTLELLPGPAGADAASAPTAEGAAPMPDGLPGRDDALRRLRAQFDRAAAASRQMVFVTGEPGIGKTALVDALLAGPAVARARIGRGQAIEQYGASEPFLPVLEALGRLTADESGAAARALLRRCAPGWLAQMPWLVEPAEALALRQAASGLSPERMLREFARFLEDLARDEPVVLVLEDLHWCDASTVELLALLGQRREPARLLVVATARMADLGADHPLQRACRTLSLRRQCSVIELPLLSTDEVGAALELRLGGAPPPQLAALLHRHSGGNPLFLAAAVDQLQARGWLVGSATGWSLGVPPERIDLGVPDDIRAMIAGQFAALPPHERDLLACASVVGEEFAAATAAAAAGIDVESCDATCDALARCQRFLGPTAPARGNAGGRTFAFRHALYRRTALDAIPEMRLRRIHARIAAHLERSGSGATSPAAARLAFHFAAAGDVARAVHFLGIAATAALAISAPREAVLHVESALALLPQLADTAEQRRCEIELRLTLGSALTLIHGFASAAVRRSNERALQLCAEKASPQQQFRVLYAHSYWLMTRADRDAMLPVARQLAALAEALDDTALRHLAASALGRCEAYAAHLDTADAIFTALLAAAGDAPSPAPGSFSVSPVISARAHHAWVLWMRGRPAAARTAARTALADAERLAHPFTLAATATHVALTEHLCGDAERAQGAAARAIDVATRNGFRPWLGIARVIRGAGRVGTGDDAAALREMQDGVRLFRSTGMRIASTLAMAFVAEGALRQGDLDAGLDAVATGLSATRATSERFFEPELWRLRGEILRAGAERSGAGDDPDAAEARNSVVRAVDTAAATGARAFALRALTTLLRWDRGTRRERQSRAALAACCAGFRDGGDTADLRAARELLGKQDP